jgi:hypothetical protein
MGSTSLPLDQYRSVSLQLKKYDFKEMAANFFSYFFSSISHSKIICENFHFYIYNTLILSVWQAVDSAPRGHADMRPLSLKVLENTIEIYFIFL